MTTNKIKDWFRQDNKTGEWFRVLIRGGEGYSHQVEILLAPAVNTKTEWDKIGDVFITRHDVRFIKEKDKSRWTHHLPDDVHDSMYRNIGPNKTDFLFEGNIYSLIDWNKFTRNDNQGCPLSLCRRGFKWYYEQTHLIMGNAIVREQTEEQPFLLMNAIHNTPDMLMIGGVAVRLVNVDLLIYGYYHIVTGYVCFNLDTTMTVTGERHTSKFSQRLKPDWQKDLIAFIETMKVRGDIIDSIETSIKTMVDTANSSLMTFNLSEL